MDARGIHYRDIPRTAISVVVRPAEFFRGMSKTGGFHEPFVFVIVMGLAACIVQVLLGLAGLGHVGNYGSGLMFSLTTIFAMPIAFAFLGFIGGGILYVVWKIAGSQENYETAYRSVAYLSALTPITAVIGVIPYAGALINSGLYLFFLVSVSHHVHGISPRKAWIIFGILMAAFAILLIRGEYKIRHMVSSMKDWRQTVEGDRRVTGEEGKSKDDIRRQADEMARQYQEQAEEAKKQTRPNP